MSRVISIEVAVERPLVPAGENLVEAEGASRPSQGLEEVVGLADELDVAVLDAVVDHLDVMAGSFVAHPVAARGTIVDFGGDRLEDRFDRIPGLGVAAWHDRGAFESPFLASRNPGADE